MGGALAVQAALVALLAVGGASEAAIKPRELPSAVPIPVSVKPVLDDLPLLKLGGKKVRPKLPDMWQKQVPLKREEARSAPSTKAERTPEAIPTAPLAGPDAEAPPPDAELVARADPSLERIDASPPDAAEPNVEGPGAADGVKEGTETDPLKARAVSQYQMRLLAWFNARFRVPVGELPCAELKALSSAVAAHVDGSRRVSGWTLVRASGNAVFDARVKATMDAIVGQELPPPPPLYPDILGSTVSPIFSGAGARCVDAPAGGTPDPGPTPDPPSPPAEEAP